MLEWWAKCHSEARDASRSTWTVVDWMNHEADRAADDKYRLRASPEANQRSCSVYGMIIISYNAVLWRWSDTQVKLQQKKAKTRFNRTYSISNLGFPNSTYKKNPLVSLKIR